MAAIPYKFVTAASTNLQVVRAGQAGNLKSIVSPGGTATFIKVYWFTPTTATPTPVVGTTIPSLTFSNPTGGLVATFSDGITGNGQMWVAVTGAAGDSDTTSATAGIPITIGVE